MGGESPEKTYTYLVQGSFKIQYTFTEAEVVLDGEGKDDLRPTDEALMVLEGVVRDCLADKFVVDALEVDAESDDLLGKQQ